MTPPKIPSFRPNEPLFPLEPLSEPILILDKPSLDRYIPDFTSQFYPSSPQPFRIPGLFVPTLPIAASPTVSPPKWTPEDTGQLMVDIFMAIDSMDFDLKRMVVNGGEAGCRFSEIVKAKDFPNKETCKNFFEKNSKADLHLSVRPLEGKGVSELYDFWVHYDKFPGRTGNRINGFYMTHPLNKNDQGPLKIEQEDPFESGKDFRAALNPSYRIPMGTAVPHSNKSSRIVMRPIGWLYDEGPGISFDISENMLKGWGMIHKKQYDDLGVEHFQMPRRMDKLLRVLPFPETRNKDYIIADGCYDKKPGALYVRPNFLQQKPSLFDALHPEEAVIDILFRETSIPLGGRGHIDLGKKGLNRITINGGLDKTVVEIELGGIPNLRFTQNGHNFSAKGLKAGKIKLTLPPMLELSKLLFPINPPEDPQIVKDRCNDPSSHPKPKRDWQPLLDKLFANVEITGIEAEELSLENSERGIKTKITGAKIQSARMKGPGSITFTGVGAKSISLEDSTTHLKVGAGVSTIGTLTLKGGEAGPKIIVKKLAGNSLSLSQKDSGIFIDKGGIDSLSIDLRKRNAVKVGMTQATSSGTIRYKNNEGKYEFKSSGDSTIEKFGLNYQKDVEGTHIDSQVKFSGKIREFFISNPATGDLTMTDTVLGSSEFNLDMDFPEVGAPSHSFTIDIDVQKANLKSGHLPIGEIGPSSLTNGRIFLTKAVDGLSGKISGNLNLLIPSIDIPLIEVATKGFSIEGHLRNIGIEGSGTLEITPEKILLTKAPQDPDKPKSLKISGTVENLVFRDNPAVRHQEMKRLRHHSVIKTQMDVAQAKIEVKDLETFEFVRPDSESGRKADLKKLKISDFSITDIQASAKIWAKFPIFGWLMGKFPQIGKIAGKLPGDIVESELKLESFDTDNNGKGRVTEISNLLIQLFEVDGRKQMARFKLPLLHLGPDAISTGKDPIELQLYFKDLDRGGDFEFKLVPEDLSQRDTWKVKEKK